MNLFLGFSLIQQLYYKFGSISCYILLYLGSFLYVAIFCGGLPLKRVEISHARYMGGGSEIKSKYVLNTI